MAVRKSAKKAASKKKAPAKKAAAKKAPARKKAAPAKKAPARKKAAPKPEPAASEAAAAAEKPAASTAKPKGKFGAQNVNLGHVFALRPRVPTSFPQAHFRTARHLLQDESYASMEEAARAVADKALELTREGPGKRGFKPGRR